MVTSGKAGISTETAVFELPTRAPANFLNQDIVNDILNNGAAYLNADFATCYSCLLAGEW